MIFYDENMVYCTDSVPIDCAVFLQYFILVQHIYEQIFHSALQAIPAFLKMWSPPRVLVTMLRNQVGTQITNRFAVHTIITFL
jgi:hypothetical protein